MATSGPNCGVSESGIHENGGECEREAAASVSEAMISCGAEESSPDLLKNTPSNIARLEDAIEQCKGRQKYLAQTSSSSDGEDVRWYFCKVPLADDELAASVPRMEIVGKSEYFRFSMRDSLALEASFLQREEELLSSWWKEYAECSEGPSGPQLCSDTKLDMQPKECSSEGDQSTELFPDEEERVGVPVKGGLYEVDLAQRHCFPVYWNGENRRVLRGHWFARKGGLDWLPLREDVAEQLEFAYRSQVWHRRTFQPSGLFAARVDLQGSMQGLHALFTGEDDTWEAWLNADSSGFSSVVSLRGNGIKLRRGYSSSGLPKPTQEELRQQKEEEMDDYCSQVPVGHLVFMVHGIGQRLEKANLVDDVGNFRHITESLAERHLTSYQRGTQRVLYIPCQWRRGLKLGGETAVEKITLDGVRNLRIMLSATVHDVLYYMSPIYCQDIINSVSNQLNRLYMKFIKRNPGYDGKVSIYGHSLGSVLSYDILCHQENLSSPFPMEWMYKESIENEESPTDLTNQFSNCSSWINLADTNSNVRHEILNGMVGTIDEEKMSSQPTSMGHKEENINDPSISVDPSPTSDAEPSTKSFSFEQALNSKQPNAVSLLEEGIQEPDQGSSGILSQEANGLNAMTSISFGVPGGDLDMVAGELSRDTSNKDKVITVLREEVDSLKARIAELESKCAGKDRSGEFCHGQEVHTTTSEQPSSQKFLPRKDDMPKSYRPYIKYTKLEFKVDTFFAVGSPLGVFLALRNIRIGIGKGKEYWQDESISEEMPGCRQMFNIFHPFDPVAYRLEPLVCKENIGKRPVIIPYHKGGKRLHIGFQEFSEDLAARSQAVVNSLKSVRVKVLTVCQSKLGDSMEEATENAQATEHRSYGSIMMERLTGSEEGRMDHMLQDKTFEHAYISAIGSHTNYWRDNDTALFILKHLYRDIPEEPNSPEQPSGDSSKNQRGSTSWSSQSETIDEDLPLTFSDSVLVKDFSSKVKKVMKNP
ncbi:hypothetical protein HHK36_009230 [Tetracentron sinense]|uniref:DDHD domain-containing protein n=1 Tax=Tetracentron sinense TaxID=13715 RepID=A0A834ZKX8_TETSI|nr:hypothetical protein HHK36_009230 [Tetracentron sinense]